MLGLGTIAKKVFGTPNDRKVKSVRPLVEKINALEPEFQKLSDEGLKEKTREFRSVSRAAKALRRSCRKPLPTAAREPGGRWVCAPSTCSSWAASSFTRATSPK